MHLIRTHYLAGALALAIAGCAADTTAPAVPAADEALAASRAQSADRCMNVEHEGVALLGVPTLPNGLTGLGGAEMAVTLGGLEGRLASVLTGQDIKGTKGQGAQHWQLVHAFWIVGGEHDGDYFLTADRAVCAPAGKDPATCRVNDVLTITHGTGIFANARGQLRNHGTIDFVNGTLGVSLKGRVCGDGL